MLYGSNEFVSKSLEAIKEECETKDIVLVFGATVNSIGNRIQRFDSDYDGKFIYFKSDLDNCHVNADEATKKCDRSGRFYIDVNEKLGEITPWEPALLWNFRSFLSLLINPSGETRNIIPAVYYQVINVFSSPFYMDPFGIRKQMQKEVSEIVDFNYLLQYFQNRMDLRSERDEKGRMLLKYYLSNIHCLLSMHWILQYECIPPYSINTLFFLCDSDLVSHITNLRYAADEKQRLLSESKSNPIVQSFKTDSEFKEIQMIKDDQMDSFIFKEKAIINDLWNKKKDKFSKMIIIEKQVDGVNRCIDIMLSKIKAGE